MHPVLDEGRSLDPIRIALRHAGQAPSLYFVMLPMSCMCSTRKCSQAVSQNMVSLRIAGLSNIKMGATQLRGRHRNTVGAELSAVLNFDP